MQCRNGGQSPRDDHHTAYVALGSNLGDRRAALAGALDALDTHPQVEVVRRSTIIETDPVGGPPDQPQYLNAVAQLSTHLSPEALHALLMQIEARFGRERSVPNAPRTLDLDLLLYDDRCIDTEKLTVPHPRMHQRRFVMAPLAEVAPEVRHPILERTAAQIAQRL